MPGNIVPSLVGHGLNTLLGIGGLISNSSANDIAQQNFREQMDFARYQYQDLKKFNSPMNQVKMLRAAGLNPALTFGNGVQSASGISQPSPNPQIPLDLAGLSSFGSLTNQLFNSDVERDKTRSEIRLNHLKAIADDWQNFIHQSFDVPEKSQDLKNKQQTLSNLVQECLLTAAKGDTELALQKLYHAEEFANYAAGGLDDQRRKNFEEEFKWISLKAKSLILEQQSQSSLNTTLAGESRSRTSLNDLEYGIRSAPEQVQAAKDSIVEEYKKLKRSNQLTKRQIDYLDKLVEMAEKENSSYWFRLAADYVLKYGEGVIDAVGLKRKVQALDALTDAAGKNAETRARRQDYNENTYEDEIIYERDKHGKTKATKAKRTIRRRR